MTDNDYVFTPKDLKDIKDKISDISIELYSLIDDLGKSITGAKKFNDTTSKGLNNMHKQLSRINNDYSRLRYLSSEWTSDIKKQSEILKTLNIHGTRTNRIQSLKSNFNRVYRENTNVSNANDAIDIINGYYEKGGYKLTDKTKEILNKSLNYWYDYLDKFNDYSKGTSRELDKRVRGEKAYEDALKGVGKSSQYTTAQLKDFHKAYLKETNKDNYMTNLNRSFVGSGMNQRAILNGLGLDSLSNWATSDRADLRERNYDIRRNAQKVKERNDLRVKGLLEQRSNAKTDEERAKIDSEISTVQNDTKQTQQLSRSAMASNFANYALKGVDSLLKDINKKIIEGIKSITKEAISTLKDVASYDLGNSLFVNSSARNQALKYGLNDSQNYAYTQTSKIMGISSEEDLFFMNSNQKELFTTLMQKEQSIYDKMTANGTLEEFQQMQVDIALLKQEFIADVVSFIVDNKDTIIYFFKEGIKILTNIMNAISNILSIFHTNKTSRYGSRTHTISASEISAYKYSGTTADSIAYSSETTNNANKNYQITINNDNKGSDNNSLSQQVSERTIASLANFFNS